MGRINRQKDAVCTSPTILLIAVILVVAGCGSSSTDVADPIEVGTDAMDSTDPLEPDTTVVSCAARPVTEDADFLLGAFSIVDGKVYVVHSGVDDAAGNIRNTSNIYVIRGTSTAGITTVWLFGSGYGDPGGEYGLLGGGFGGPSRDAAADVADVDNVVGACMGLSRAEARLDFVTPHAHLDHINSEFFNELDAIGYDLSASPIYVHVRDEFQATCKEACCGQAPCAGEDDPYFANPFLPAWTTAQLDRVIGIGETNDPCDAEVMKFDAPSGVWSVKAIPGHTPGALNLDNTTLGVRIAGSVDGFCADPLPVTLLSSHGAASPL